MKKQIFMIVMIILIVVVCVISISLGQINVPIVDTIHIVFNHLRIPGFTGIELDQAQEAVIWHIRLPRVIVGLLAGAALAISGAAALNRQARCWGAKSLANNRSTPAHRRCSANA